MLTRIYNFVCSLFGYGASAKEAAAAMQWMSGLSGGGSLASLAIVKRFAVPLHRRGTKEGITHTDMARLLMEALPYLTDRDVTMFVDSERPWVRKALECISRWLLPNRSALLGLYKAWPTALLAMVAEALHAAMIELLDEADELTGEDRRIVAALSATVCFADVLEVPKGPAARRWLLAAPLKDIKSVGVYDVNRRSDNCRTRPGYIAEKDAINRLMDWSGGSIGKLLAAFPGKLVLAGGIVRKALMRNTRPGKSDYDFWLVGVRTAEEATALMEDVVGFLVREHADWHEVYLAYKNCVLTVTFVRNPRHDYANKVIRIFQFPMRLFRSMQQVLLSFDYANVRCGFDGKRISMTESCALALDTLTCLANPMLATTLHRAVKQEMMNFTVFVPLTAEAKACAKALAKWPVHERIAIAEGCGGSGTAIMALKGVKEVEEIADGPSLSALMPDAVMDPTKRTVWMIDEVFGSGRFNPKLREDMIARAEVMDPARRMYTQLPFYDPAFIKNFKGSQDQ